MNRKQISDILLAAVIASTMAASACGGENPRSGFDCNISGVRKGPCHGAGGVTGPAGDLPNGDFLRFFQHSELISVSFCLIPDACNHPFFRIYYDGTEKTKEKR